MSADLGRDDSSTFHVNLAPMLDIIVSIIPMLLLSVVFVQIAAIDTPVAASGSAAANAIQERAKLYAQSDSTFELRVGGTTPKVIKIDARDGKRDWDSLKARLIEAKNTYPQIQRLELYPAQNLPMQSIVEVMDHVQGFNGAAQFQAVSLGNITGDL